MIGVIESFPTAALTESRTLFELGLVVVLAAAPLIAKVLRFPSILVLFALGSAQVRSTGSIPMPCLASK